MLKTPEEAVRALLTQTPDTAEVFGDRIYAVIAPTSASYPFAVYRRASVSRESTLDGPSGSTTTVLDLIILSDTYTSCREASDKARQVLDGFSGIVDSVVLNNVYLESESDDYVSLQGTELPPSYSVTLSLQILWIETERN